MKSCRIGAIKTYFSDVIITKERAQDLRVKLSKLLRVEIAMKNMQLCLRQQKDHPNWRQRWKYLSASNEGIGADVRASF